MTDSPPAYRVLARAYRPQTFRALLGQDAMVQTLANAIKRERIAHAFLMTGVRGVGKTTTARLIAKALNCIGPDGAGGPTIDPCGVCEPCRAIAEGRHIDVIEMDAASHNGIDDVREISDAVRYSAVSARYKMYIIDEAHMLSKQAWNGLLKTLEEPPAHVKFLFATTEVAKVPVTVLSRCQRFDLRRIPADLLQAHFAEIIEKEGLSADGDALAMIAAASEGSARDGLSILDQAIAHADFGAGKAHVTAEQVRSMLGLADRGSTWRLLEQIVDGDAPAMLATLAEQDSLGVEPVATINALLELLHRVTVSKAARGVGLEAQPESDRKATERWAEQLSFPVLHRLWQLLLKGHAEVVVATRPGQACQMALLRLIHAAELPDPAELARMLTKSGAVGDVAAGSPGDGALQPAGEASSLASASPHLPVDFPDLVELVRARRALFAFTLEQDVGLVSYAPPALELRPLKPLDADFCRELAALLKDATDRPWRITTSDAPSAASLGDQRRAAEEELDRERRVAPIVAAALAAFPGAQLLPNDTRDARMKK